MKRDEATVRLSHRDLFWIFFKAGMAFGGGLGILAVLEDELVAKRRVISREEFLTTYSIGRIVPSGTMTALAVAYGHKFGGYIGTVVALVALVLPAFLLTILLTLGYRYLRTGAFLKLLPVTILPAALAFILAAALKLGKDIRRPSLELLLAAATFAAALFLHLNPSILLLAGGVIGIFILPGKEGAGK